MPGRGRFGSGMPGWDRSERTSARRIARPTAVGQGQPQHSPCQGAGSRHQPPGIVGAAIPSPHCGPDDVPAPRLADDIPLARRSRPAAPRRASPLKRLAWLLLACGLLSGSGALLALGPLRPLLTPEPVAGLNAKLSRDGRLLGHFPYPEAPASALVSFAPGHSLRPDAAEALLAMQAAARQEGHALVVLSAFRPIALQNQLFFAVKAERNQSASDRARVSAPPGFSEHSTGYAVDLGDGHAAETHLSARFEQTGTYRWLADNAARFHFHLSFPRDNRQGVAYEPWHWRYEGSTEALRLFEPAQRLAR